MVRMGLLSSRDYITGLLKPQPLVGQWACVLPKKMVMQIINDRRLSPLEPCLQNSPNPFTRRLRTVHFPWSSVLYFLTSARYLGTYFVKTHFSRPALRLASE